MMADTLSFNAKIGVVDFWVYQKKSFWYDNDSGLWGWTFLRNAAQISIHVLWGFLSRLKDWRSMNSRVHF